MKTAFFLSAAMSGLGLSRAHGGHGHHDRDVLDDEHRHLRALQNDPAGAAGTSSMAQFLIGEHRFANKQAFIDSGARCGQTDPTDSDMRTAVTIVRDWVANRKRSGSSIQAIVAIPIYFHIITAGSVGAKTDSQIKGQLDVINTAYGSRGFSFVLKGITRTDNSSWYTGVSPGSQAEKEMKQALRIGSASTFNVYLTSPGGGLLGWATFPSNYAANPSNDGVVIRNESIPGGSIPSYNEGDTLTHETGHWLGLYHTFQSKAIPLLSLFLPSFLQLRNGCKSRQGDDISDTPAEKTSASGCPIGRDTCSNIAGADPIHNFMDYSDDACLTEFTPQQAEKMQAMWATYRSGK